MQELIEKIEHAISYNVEGGLVAKYTWEELLQDSYYLLEKEKKQIIDSDEVRRTLIQQIIHPNKTI